VKNDTPVISQSMLKLWRHCQRKFDYRYRQHLVPKRLERPLYLGSWGHACLEAHYRDGDWKLGHAPYVEQYDKLFEEEQKLLDGKTGEPLPSQVRRIMESYLWYYRFDRWKVIATEVEFSVPVKVTGYGRARVEGRIDLIAEDEDRLNWVWDHKWPTDIPPMDAFHGMDPQLVIYPWAAEKVLGIETAGVVFNYVRARPPTVPTLNKDKSISRKGIITDHPTVYRFLVENGLDPRDYGNVLDPLEGSSELLARYRLSRSEVVTRRVLREAGESARAILANTDPVRNVTRDCSWCVYLALCRAELFGLDPRHIRSRDFVIEEGTERRYGNDTAA
jgi:PD-(D/E)XK nuclease superfamily